MGPGSCLQVFSKGLWQELEGWGYTSSVHWKVVPRLAALLPTHGGGGRGGGEEHTGELLSRPLTLSRVLAVLSQGFVEAGEPAPKCCFSGATPAPPCTPSLPSKRPSSLPRAA